MGLSLCHVIDVWDGRFLWSHFEDFGRPEVLGWLAAELPENVNLVLYRVHSLVLCSTFKWAMGPPVAVETEAATVGELQALHRFLDFGLGKLAGQSNMIVI